MSPAETERAPRGSTRVVCRVRPLATSERGSCVETRGAEVTLAGSPSFSFDAVFPPTASNDAVFDAVRPTLEDVRAGINGAVLAYGQSGAGKSHTMNGGPGDPGVVQRAIADLVSHRDAKVLAGETCRLTFSALELYNERLADLMTCAGARDFAESSASSLRVVADPRRGVWPRGAAEILLGDDVDVEALLETASARRSTGATDLNKDSSRSHLVVILRMETATCHSKLFLVDLAGCEQVRRSGAAGSRLDEACGINKSLSALGNVVAALTAAKAEDDLSASADASPAKEKEKKKGSVQHVPYRDSKLTFLLSEALGGNARAVLVTCLSPSVADAAESLSTLRFGVRARRIVARPKRNVNASPEKASQGASAAAAAAELAELRSEVATLRRRLEAVRDDQKDTSASSAKITDRDTYPYARVKHMPTFRLWVGLCVAYFAVDALVLWA